MRFRALGAAVAALLAVAGVAGCRTNVGTAAVVDGHRITESDVNEFVTPAGIDRKLAAQAQAQGQSIQTPKTQVLTILIQQKIFEDTLAAEHIMYTEGTLNSVHDAAASEFFQTQVSGTGFETTLAKRLPRFGIEPSFIATLLRVAELRYLIHKHHRTGSLIGLVKQANVHVSVSPRYGTWQASQLAVSGKTVVPSYLTVQPSAAG